jgi:hypothetical protein
MIRDFDHFYNTVLEISELKELGGCHVVIDAADYLETRLLRSPSMEPLLPALGGLPFRMKTLILDDLKKFAEYDIVPTFIFNGIDLRRPEDPFQQRQVGAAVNAEAWVLYDNHKAEESVLRFKESR